MPRTKDSKRSKRIREAASREEQMVREFENTLEGYSNTFDSLMQDNIKTFKQQCDMLLQRTNSALLQIKICDLLEMNLERIDDWEKQLQLLSAKKAQNSPSTSSTSLLRPSKTTNPKDEGYLTADSSACGSLGASSMFKQQTLSQQQTSRLRTLGPLNSARARRPRRSRSACGDYGLSGSAIKSKPSAVASTSAAAAHIARSKMRTPTAARPKALSCNRTPLNLTRARRPRRSRSACGGYGLSGSAIKSKPSAVASTSAAAAHIARSKMRTPTAARPKALSCNRTPLNLTRARRPRRSRSACGGYGLSGSAIKSKPSAVASTSAAAAHIARSKMRTPTAARPKALSCNRTPLNLTRARRPRRSRSACGDYGLSGSAIKSKPSAVASTSAAAAHSARSKMRTSMAARPKALSRCRTLLNSTRAQRPRRSRSACGGYGLSGSAIKSKPSAVASTSAAADHCARSKMRTSMGARPKALSCGRTPKVCEKLPTFLRFPNPGELVLSQCGSPLVASGIPGKLAHLNIPLRCGVISMQPRKLSILKPDLLANMDSETLQQLRTLHDNMDKIISMADKAGK